jgi:hypothetical protein
MSGKVVVMDRPEVGRRVRLKQRVERYPEFSVPRGSTGTIVEVTDALVSVKIDSPVVGAEGWDNCLHFYDATTYGDQQPDGWDRFTEQTEYIG